MHSNSPILVRRARLDEIVDLRHVILRAGLPRAEAIFNGDELPTSRHYAAIDEMSGRVTGCTTLHLNEWEGAPAWQLRGMATDSTVRRAGIGRRLIEFLESDLADRPDVPQLWCNARTPAVGFYERMGWIVVSDIFDIPTAGPHVRMTRRL